MVTPVGLASVGALLPDPFSFNLVVSGVSSPTEDSFFRGSRLGGMNPASPQLDAAHPQPHPALVRRKQLTACTQIRQIGGTAGPLRRSRRTPHRRIHIP